MQLKPAERKPLSELKRIYLTMEIRNQLTMEQRKQIMNNVLKTYDRDQFAVKDRPFYKRIAMVSLINSYAKDPAAVLK